MDNLELNDPSLVAAVKRLNITISDKDAHSADVLYDQCCYKFTHDSKPAESNREDNKSVEKALMKNVYNATKNKKDKSKISHSSTKLA